MRETAKPSPPVEPPLFSSPASEEPRAAVTFEPPLFPSSIEEPRTTVTLEPALFASSIEEPRTRSGFSIWLAAAAALVIGIGIGFASGYRIGKDQSVVAAPAEGPAAPTPGANGGQPFSESSVSEPINLNPSPVVPAPEKPAGPLREQPSVAGRAARRPPAPVVGGRVPPRNRALAAEPPASELPTAAGPGSLQVVSRPAGAQVILDGKTVGKTPLLLADVASGDHNVQLVLAGFKGWSTTVGVKTGSATRVAASLEQ